MFGVLGYSADPPTCFFHYATVRSKKQPQSLKSSNRGIHKLQLYKDFVY